LEIGKSGLITASINQDITGQNISNAGTNGYSRQRTVSSAKIPAGTNYVISQIYNKRVGQGVQVTDVTQYRSDYLDQQYRDEDSKYNYYEYRGQGLTYLSGVLNELNDDSSVTICLDNFTSALSDLVKNPKSEESRTNVQQRATTLTQNINYVYSEMKDLWEDQNTSVQTVADSINSKAEQITVLNTAIANFERDGSTANDLRDERNNLLDELSGLVNITYSDNQDNSSMVDVQVGGITLVKGTDRNTVDVDNTSKTNASTGEKENVLKLTDSVSGGMSPPTYTFSTTAGTDTIEVTSGELFAHMQLLTSDDANTPGIPYYINRLNQFAQNLAKEVNDLHSTGYTYPDAENGNTSKQGVNFFDVSQKKDLSGNPVVDGDGKPVWDYSKITAGNLSLSADVKTSVWNIAASSKKIDLSVSSTNATNSNVASKLYDLFKSGGFYSDLNSIVDHLGIASSTNSGMLDTSQSMLNSVSKQRTSLSGVSLDEETTNLIMYQQSYNVASRMVTTVDEMLNTLINGTGRVGL
jgi:flagellar hook-associated protein 1 FlgK